MKSIQNFLLPLMFVLLFLSASCAATDNTTIEGNNDINTTENHPAVTAGDETVKPDTEIPSLLKQKADIQIDHASDERLANFGVPYEYTVDENGGRIMIRTDIPIKDFAFFEIGYDIEDDNFKFYPGSILYTIDELPPERPFVVTMYMPEIIPTHGFSFSDGDNTKRNYLIQESGMDGSIFLVEFPVNDVMSNANRTVSGRVEISFNYEKISGSASNQFAIWIEDMNGNLVRTIYATQWTAKGGYKSRPDSIPIWVGKAGLASMSKDEVDAVSGATPKKGPLHYNWDLKDSSGNSVAPGEYRFFVEGTLRWKNQVMYSGIIDISRDFTEIAATSEFRYEASDRYAALTDDSAENLMIGPVTVRFIPDER